MFCPMCNAEYVDPGPGELAICPECSHVVELKQLEPERSVALAAHECALVFSPTGCRLEGGALRGEEAPSMIHLIAVVLCRLVDQKSEELSALVASEWEKVVAERAKKSKGVEPQMDTDRHRLKSKRWKD